MFYISLLLFTFSVSITPGPNNLLLLTTGINYSISKGLPYLFGVLSGVCCLSILTGIGFGEVLKLYPHINLAIKLIGSCYILYLAYKIATSITKNDTKTIQKPFSYWQAFFLQPTNPKVWINLTSAYSIFGNFHESLLLQVAIITLTVVSTSTICALAWLCGGSLLKDLMTNEKYLRIFNVFMAILLVISVWFIIF